MIYYISPPIGWAFNRDKVQKAMEQEIATQLRDGELGRTVTVESSASYADVLALREPEEDRTVLTYLARDDNGDRKVAATVIPGQNPRRYNFHRQLAANGTIEDLRVHFLKKTDPDC